MKMFALVMSIAAMGLCAESWQGVISDAKCGAGHGADKLNTKCVRGCIKGGQAPVFVTMDGKVLKIHNPDAVTKDENNLGVKVTVTGKLMDGAVHVDSVKAE